MYIRNIFLKLSQISFCKYILVFMHLGPVHFIDLYGRGMVMTYIANHCHIGKAVANDFPLYMKEDNLNRVVEMDDIQTSPG